MSSSEKEKPNFFNFGESRVQEYLENQRSTSGSLSHTSSASVCSSSSSPLSHQSNNTKICLPLATPPNFSLPAITVTPITLNHPPPHHLHRNHVPVNIPRSKEHHRTPVPPPPAVSYTEFCGIFEPIMTRSMRKRRFEQTQTFPKPTIFPSMEPSANMPINLVMPSRLKQATSALGPAISISPIHHHPHPHHPNHNNIEESISVTSTTSSVKRRRIKNL